MTELKNLEEERRTVPKGVASNEMCVFLILNISSLQLIPMNVVAYRSQYGSVNPTAIVGPAILATAVSTLAGVIFCKIMDSKWSEK
jgi:spore maturation protein A